MLDDENTSISAIDNTEENHYNQTPDYNLFTQETPLSTEPEPAADSYFVEPVNPTDSDSNPDSALETKSEPEPELSTSPEAISQPKNSEALQETQRKTYKDLTDEEKRRIIARSDEVGIHQTAVEFGTNWQLVVAVRMRGGAANTMSLADYETKYKKRPDKVNTHKITRRTRRSKTLIQKKTQIRSVPSTSIVSTFSTDRTSEKARQRELLKENAMLQKEIATLSWQIDRLRSAVRDLVE